MKYEINTPSVISYNLYVTAWVAQLAKAFDTQVGYGFEPRPDHLHIF